MRDSIPWVIPRYRPEDDLATERMPSVLVRQCRQSSAQPTTLRLAPLRYCFQCGVTIPLWREDCPGHDRRQGRGLPPPPRLVPLEPDVAQAQGLTLPCGKYGHQVLYS